jgi:hypothetical protein
MEIRR